MTDQSPSTYEVASDPASGVTEASEMLEDFHSKQDAGQCANPRCGWDAVDEGLCFLCMAWLEEVIMPMAVMNAKIDNREEIEQAIIRTQNEEREACKQRIKKLQQRMLF